MKCLYLLPALVLALMLSSCTNDQLVEVAPLERDLLITWIALERGDSTIASSYHQSAQAKWGKLRQKFRLALLTEAEKRSVSLVNLWTNNLNIAFTNNQPQNALVNIQHLQNQLKTLRPRYGIVHPADHLYEFIYSWDQVGETCADQMMCLLEWKEFEALYEQADSQWRSFQKTRPLHHDLVFPGIGNNSTSAEHSALALTQALENFGQLLDEADHTILLAPSEAVKSAFLDYVAVIVAYPGAEPL
ncbi:hypothetical protein [Neolewinella persica]|uniref:hypothetical protein n=1 Tax=Neolewinella persica TaxID=70998 RepID=UPI000376CE39|nr:hypothetical protein [Neolewinella persica]